jgi:hypothetical protein
MHYTNVLQKPQLAIACTLAKIANEAYIVEINIIIHFHHNAVCV